jgi:hypothetical protein
MIYQNKISNIENIIVSSICLLTLPCQHGCKIIYKNGTTKGITLLTPHIADIVKTINKEVNNTCVQSWVSNAKIISEIYNIDYEEDFKNAKIKKEELDSKDMEKFRITRKMNMLDVNPYVDYLTVYKTKDERYIDFFEPCEWEHGIMFSLEDIINYGKTNRSNNIIFDINVLYEEHEEEIKFENIKFGGNDFGKIDIKEINFIKDTNGKIFKSCKLDINYGIPLSPSLYHNVVIKCKKPIAIRYKSIEFINKYDCYRFNMCDILFGNRILCTAGMYGMYINNIEKYIYSKDDYSGDPREILISLQNFKKRSVSYLTTYTDKREPFEEELGEEIDLDINSDMETKTKKMNKYIKYIYDETTGLFLSKNIPF